MSDRGVVPRACFRYASAPIANAHDELLRMLADHLGARFVSARLIRSPLSGAVVIEVQTGPMPGLMVLLRRSKYGNDEWLVVIGAERLRDLPGLLLGQNLADFSPELIEMCREIHAVLISVSGITDIRWYLEGRSSQSAAVTAPEELPWDQE
jgi:hypothetical protein